MNRADAYRLLAAELEQCRNLGYDTLVGSVGQQASSKTVCVAEEEIIVEISVR